MRGCAMHATPVVLVLLTTVVLALPAGAQDFQCTQFGDTTTCRALPKEPGLEDRVKKYTDRASQRLADMWFQRAMQRLHALVNRTRELPPTTPYTLKSNFPAAEWRNLAARLPQVLFVSTVQEARDALETGKRRMDRPVCCPRSRAWPAR